MELINKIRKSRKGFTLVEIIVVLVILAILAAFMIPSMMGFVNEAKKKAAIAEQREVYVAAQAIVTEQYAKLGKTEAEKAGVLNVSTTAEEINGTEYFEATNLGSDLIGKTADASLLDTSKAMKEYLKGDITAASADDVAAKKNSVWKVYVKDGHVTRVSYTRDGIELDDLVPSAAIKELT